MNKEYISDEKLKKIVEETIGNSDPFWNEPVFKVVKKIIDLPENAEITFSELIENVDKSNSKFMTEINEAVIEVCKKINITLDKSKHDGQFLGLPFNISFVKKTLSDEIINSIPESLKDFIYIHNGDIYTKQPLSLELEIEYGKFKKKLNLPKCPNCGKVLTHLVPDGTFYCSKCEKKFKNYGDIVGEETSSPYTKDGVLY